jgi:hypothetical protein
MDNNLSTSTGTSPDERARMNKERLIAMMTDLNSAFEERLTRLAEAKIIRTLNNIPHGTN